jgi:SPP1 gp7 family putative phage head morphogenesis protein
MPTTLKGILQPKLVKRGRIPNTSFPRRFEREYYSMLLQHLRDVRRAVDVLLVNKIPGFSVEANIAFRGDDFVDQIGDLATVLDAEFNRMVAGLKPELDDVAANATFWFQNDYIQKMSKAYGIALFGDNGFTTPLGKSFVLQNTSLIKKLDTEIATQVQNTLLRGLEQGERPETLRGAINDIIGGKKYRAKRIARDQMSKFSGNLNQAKQQSIGVTHYYWRTSRDERVRATHAKNNGKRFAWNKPPANTGHPTEDVNCRCWAEPDMSQVLEELGFTEKQEKKIETSVAVKNPAYKR